jgi:hypothetical protein
VLAAAVALPGDIVFGGEYMAIQWLKLMGNEVVKPDPSAAFPDARAETLTEDQRSEATEVAPL